MGDRREDAADPERASRRRRSEISPESVGDAADPPAADAPAAEPPAADPPAADPPAPPTTTTIQTIQRRNWTRGLLLLAGVLLILVALGFGAARIGEIIHKPAAVATLEQIEAAPDARSATADVVDGGTATAHWSESLGKAVLVTNVLPELAADEMFEVWFVTPEGATESVATFVDETPPMTISLDGRVEEGDVVMVTVEQTGGSATGRPTSDPIVAIPTD